MKRLSTLFFFLNLCFVLIAQDTLSIGEVFDFEINDIFQYKTSYCMYSSCYVGCPESLLKVEIINKYYSQNHDTLFYVRKKDGFNRCATPVDYNYYNFMSGTIDTVFYYNLNQEVLSFYTADIDSNYTIYGDTSILNLEYNQNFNNVVSNGYINFIGDLGSSRNKTFTFGLGLTSWYECSEGTGGCNICELIYYKKNSDEFGELELYTGIMDAANTQSLIQPNPFKDFISLNNNVSFESIVILDALGNVVWNLNRTEVQSQIDLSNLAKGIYFINFVDKNINYSTKILKIE